MSEPVQPSAAPALDVEKILAEAVDALAAVSAEGRLPARSDADAKDWSRRHALARGAVIAAAIDRVARLRAQLEKVNHD